MSSFDDEENYKSSLCRCDNCIANKTCRYCDKHASLAFIIAMYALDPDSVISFRACDNPEHIKRANEDCYIMENGKAT